MAYNVELRVSAGGASAFSGDGQKVNVATHKSLVEGLLDTGGKLKSDIVPDWLFNGARNGGTITADKTFKEVFLQIKTALGLGTLTNTAAAALMNGAYIEVNADSVVVSGTDYFRGNAAIGDDGVANQVSLTLERGDRLTLINYQMFDDTVAGMCSTNSFNFATWPPTVVVYHETESACTTGGGTWLSNLGGDPIEFTNWSVTNSTYPEAIAGASEGQSVKGLMSAANIFKLHNLVNIKSLATEFGLDGNGNLTIDDATASLKGKASFGTGLEISSGAVTLRKSTTSLLGGVIVSTGLEVDGNANLTLRKATSSLLGGVIIPTTGGLEVDASGNITLRKATSSLLGGIIVPTTGGLSVDASGNLTLTPQSGQIASDAEAKAGTENTKIMTPLRVWDQTKNLLGLRIYTNLTNANAANHPTGAYAFVQV